MRASSRLPDPVDPAAPPRRLAQAAAAVLIGGVVLALFGMLGMARTGGAPVEPTLLQELMFGAWLASLPVGGSLLLVFNAIGRRRLRRFERRAGFLPRKGRVERPATGRTALFRVEYGQRAGRVCLMLARWDYHVRHGWRRSEVIHHAWHSPEDPVTLGDERARMTALAEQLEEEADDARLEYLRQYGFASERLAEREATRKRAAWLVEQFARDSR